MTENEKPYPIAEMFDSCQGEGHWVGTRMFFIRLAGCTVGKPFPGEKHLRVEGKPTTMKIAGELRLPIYQEMCTTYDGRTFPCDTDYRVKERLTGAQIADYVPHGVKHICLTGGEPLMHDLMPLVRALNTRTQGLKEKLMLHVETSGTIPVDKAFSSPEVAKKVWIAVSPKFNVLPEMLIRANELKVLVDADFSIEKLPKETLTHPRVFVQPINEENTVNRENLQRCIDLQQKFPDWRISAQFHKFLNVR